MYVSISKMLCNDAPGTALEVRGIPCIGYETDHAGNIQQLIVSRSFGEKVTTVADAAGAVHLREARRRVS